MTILSITLPIHYTRWDLTGIDAMMQKHRYTQSQEQLTRMHRDRFKLSVRCYAGHRSEETPISFVIGSRQVEVLEVIDRWLAPTHRYFKIRGNDTGVYILRHDGTTDEWELTLFNSGTREESRLSCT
jgi:hypothetical protein